MSSWGALSPCAHVGWVLWDIIDLWIKKLILWDPWSSPFIQTHSSQMVTAGSLFLTEAHTSSSCTNLCLCPLLEKSYQAKVQLVLALLNLYFESDWLRSLSSQQTLPSLELEYYSCSCDPTMMNSLPELKRYSAMLLHTRLHFNSRHLRR